MLIRLLVTLALAIFLRPMSSYSLDSETTLECHRRVYMYKATKTDVYGRQCWDYIVATSCWGRCDSLEIPDWQFPYKKSIHPVCIHERKQRKRAILKNCDPEVDPELKHYFYVDAVSCSCQMCNSSSASCESHHQSSTAMTP